MISSPPRLPPILLNRCFRSFRPLLRFPRISRACSRPASECFRETRAGMRGEWIRRRTRVAPALITHDYAIHWWMHSRSSRCGARWRSTRYYLFCCRYSDIYHRFHGMRRRAAGEHVPPRRGKRRLYWIQLSSFWITIIARYLSQLETLIELPVR